MKNILFMIPDSTGIRNYLYSDILKFLKGKVNVFILSPLPDEIFDTVRKLHKIDIHFTYIKLPKEKLLGRWLRETATFARLMLNAKRVNNQTILTNWNYNPQGGYAKRLFNKSNRIIGSLISKRIDLILYFEHLARNLWSRDIIESYAFLLNKYSIDKIFVTHQRVAHLMPVCLAAKKLEIEIISVIYSWDNLPKARLHVLADKYLVWSDYMKNEMAIYYPEILQDKVFVTGTPQFEFYKNKELIIDREIFAQMYGLNSSKKWILYSGGDTLTSPYDQNYLEDLAESLQGDNSIQIIFRRSPADFSNRFDTVLAKFETKIYVLDPVWKIGASWASNIPLIKDFDMLANIAYHSVLAINVGSTIAHDFACYNKPTIYVNYNHKISKFWNIHTLNNFQHFKSMKELDAVAWINDKCEWRSLINNVINNTEKFATQRQIWFGMINLNGQSQASKIIAELLLA